jgi:hypothetical protein
MSWKQSVHQPQGCVKTLKLPASSFVSVRVIRGSSVSPSKIRSTKSHEQTLTGSPSFDKGGKDYFPLSSPAHTLASRVASVAWLAMFLSPGPQLL